MSVRSSCLSCYLSTSDLLLFDSVVAFHLHRNLQKAESRMEKLSQALDEVDQKVAQYRHRFETLTKEAAELKIKLDKENETILAAETLVSKLDGEYTRWSSQVKQGENDGYSEILCRI